MECAIRFDGPAWNCVTSEAKDLAKKLLQKNPRLRLSAREALSHPWFTLEFAGSCTLSLAEENMSKYCNRGYFNLESIKPDFSTVRLSPLNSTQDLELVNASPKCALHGANEIVVPVNIRRRTDNLCDKLASEVSAKSEL